MRASAEPIPPVMPPITTVFFVDVDVMITHRSAGESITGFLEGRNLIYRLSAGSVLKGGRFAFPKQVAADSLKLADHRSRDDPLVKLLFGEEAEFKCSFLERGIFGVGLFRNFGGIVVADVGVAR